MRNSYTENIQEHSHQVAILAHALAVLRTMRTAKSRIGDRLVTEKDGTAWVCYLRN